MAKAAMCRGGVSFDGCCWLGFKVALENDPRAAIELGTHHACVLHNPHAVAVVLRAIARLAPACSARMLELVFNVIVGSLVNLGAARDAGIVGVLLERFVVGFVVWLSVCTCRFAGSRAI